MPPTLLTRLSYLLKLYALKALVSLHFLSRRLFPPPRHLLPTYTKSYPSADGRPLTHNVWVPPDYSPSSPRAPPLLIDLHGGGFCIGGPGIDNDDNAALCRKYGLCIVSLDYRKAPAHPFPAAVDDVTALVAAVLDDESLPTDRGRSVALIGYSAGGTLALAAAQSEALQGRVAAVIAVYPATDFGRGVAWRLSTATPLPDGRRDILTDLSPAFNWAYVPSGQDLRDPRLAPLYAHRARLPEKLYFIGAEFDMLCQEVREMAEKMADADGESGADRTELGASRTGWRCGGVTWEEIDGVEHSFNQRGMAERNEKVRRLWERKTDEMHANIAEWLYREVYS